MCEDFIESYFFLGAAFFAALRFGAAFFAAGFFAARLGAAFFTAFFTAFFFAAIVATSFRNFFIVYRELMTIVTRVHSLDQIHYSAL